MNILDAKKALPIEFVRQETTEIIRALRENRGIRMQVHGAPGRGKSHVLASVAKELEKEKSINVLLTRARISADIQALCNPKPLSESTATLWL